MKIVGITGGIGSGKSTVCKVFETLGVPVFYADDEANNITSNNKDVVQAIKTTFGDEVYDAEGKLNRRLLGTKVFGEPEKLKALNAIVHPAVGQRWKDWLREHAAAPYVVKEAAILIETGGHKVMDEVVLVTAPMEMRLQRVMQRDQVTEGEVRARMARQMADEEKQKFASFILMNDGTELLLPQIIAFHRKMSKDV